MAGAGRGTRRGRIPFRRGRRWISSRRQGKWIDLFSHVNADDCRFPATQMQCTPPNLTSANIDWAFSGAREMIRGELDFLYSDKTEVRLERVVGSISVSLRETVTDPELFAFPFWRMGMYVMEDVEDPTTVGDMPNLWETDDLEDFEWMWLKQGYMLDSGIYLAPAAGQSVLTGFSFDIDVRVRRKLGRRDHLIMIGQISHALVVPFTTFAEYQYQLRGFFV